MPAQGKGAHIAHVVFLYTSQPPPPPKLLLLLMHAQRKGTHVAHIVLLYIPQLPPPPKLPLLLMHARAKALTSHTSSCRKRSKAALPLAMLGSWGSLWPAPAGPIAAAFKIDSLCKGGGG